MGSKIFEKSVAMTILSFCFFLFVSFLYLGLLNPESHSTFFLYHRVKSQRINTILQNSSRNSSKFHAFSPRLKKSLIEEFNKTYFDSPMTNLCLKVPDWSAKRCVIQDNYSLSCVLSSRIFDISPDHT